MNRILNYINATLISLDIPPLTKPNSKRSNLRMQERTEVMSNERE